MRKRLPNRGVKNYRVERYYCVNLAKEKIMAKTMKLTIITPNGTILDREGVTYLEVKGTEDRHSQEQMVAVFWKIRKE